jgi:hypothetical protein
MNAPIRTLAPSEARAHVEILAELDRAIDHCNDVRLPVVHVPLLSFFPRCNCGRVLMFGSWHQQKRVVACACGYSCWEARL